MAKDLVEKGALLDPEPDFVTGLHSWPNTPYGKICTKSGPLMAAAGFFRIRLYGKGGHGSLPHLSRNPLDCASEIMTEAKKIIPRDNVLTFCSCNGGTNNTIIPDEAELMGTIRFLDPDKGKKMLEDFKQLVENTAEKNGRMFRNKSGKKTAFSSTEYAQFSQRLQPSFPLDGIFRLAFTLTKSAGNAATFGDACSWYPAVIRVALLGFLGNQKSSQRKYRLESASKWQTHSAGSFRSAVVESEPVVHR